MGMLATFFQERRSDKAATIEEYKAWLQLHRHDELVGMLANNLQLSGAIDRLLQNQHGEVMDKLAQLDEVISTVASHLADFKPIAQAMAVQSRLSNQAVSILSQMNKANASQFMELAVYGGTQYEITDGSGGNLEISEKRFIDDDLRILCSSGLLIAENSGDGCRIFTITRAGAALGGE